MNASEMTRRDFERVPMRQRWDAEVRCAAFVVLPAVRRWWRWRPWKREVWERRPELHDSGYRLIDFVALNDHDEPICRLSGCSDVLHLDGIGGYGYRWLERCGGVPSSVPPRGWSVDCLPRSGLLRFFARGAIVCDAALSSFEVYATDEPRSVGGSAARPRP